jgi:hypothetical protein
MTKPTDLTNRPVKVINIGLELDWRPPTGGDERLLALLAKLQDD